MPAPSNLRRRPCGHGRYRDEPSYFNRLPRESAPGSSSRASPTAPHGDRGRSPCCCDTARYNVVIRFPESGRPDMRLAALVVVALAGIGCAARAEDPARALESSAAVREHPPVQQFQSCYDMWRAGWTDGVRMYEGRSAGMHSGWTEPYPPSWQEAERRTYVLNARRSGNWHVCSRQGTLPLLDPPTEIRAGTPHSGGPSGRFGQPGYQPPVR